MNRIKKNISFPEFLQCIKACERDVYFVTDDGDRLNLKSVLSEYIFLSAAISSDLVDHGYIVVEEDSDLGKLQDFLEE